MNCQNCHEPIETGAAYCGNCGQALVPGLAAAFGSRPGYAFSLPDGHRGETRALLSLILGVIGLVSAIFIVVLGLICGVAGVVLSTMSRSGRRRGLSTVGLILSSLAVLFSLAVWAHSVKQVATDRQKAASQNSAPLKTAAGLSTPCYTVGFVDTFNVSNSPPSCDMSAYSGPTLATSANAFKIYANQTAVTSEAAFGTVARQALEKDVKTSLPGYVVDTEQAALFAGSPAYYVHASDKVHGIAVVEAAVYHKTTSGKNVFILVHALAGKTADLTTLEAQWQWK